MSNSSMTSFEKEVRERLDGLRNEALDEIFDDMTGRNSDPITEEDEGDE